MTYDDLNVGMNLICERSDGTKKGIDAFGEKSVVFQSKSSIAQFYCKAADVPRWHIRPSKYVKR
mgnify:CR=1 FL=1